jgi:hypothetical protein
MLVADFTKDLLERILQRYQPHDGTELVHHHGHMRVCHAELLDQVVERFGFRHQ